MKIALKAPNGCYLTAEEGGGIDTRDPATPVAVQARGAEINAWETFDAIESEGFVALQTSNGYYLTAENGGGGAVRTNAREVGPWERFVNIDSAFLTWDGQHYLALEEGSDVLSARAVVPRFTIVPLEEPPRPPANLKLWRGAFAIPGALAGIPYGDGSRIWTPAYGCYDGYWRQAILDAYRARDYTHFVYNCAGLPYANDYPELADDPARVARDLDELRQAGLIPVVCATDDRNPFVLCESFVINAAQCPIVFPVWEMNGPLGNEDKAIEEQNCKDAISRTREAAPDADCYLHFTPGHGSISYASEQGGWEWCQANGTVGLLAQGPNKISSTDPVYEGKGLETTACRLLGMAGYIVPDWDGSSVPPSWEGMNQLTVKFEWGIYESYYASLTEDALVAYTKTFMQNAPHVSGFCDGGPAPA